MDLRRAHLVGRRGVGKRCGRWPVALKSEALALNLRPPERQLSDHLLSMSPTYDRIRRGQKIRFYRGAGEHLLMHTQEMRYYRRRIQTGQHQLRER
jgi:hypothetical protein